MRGAKGGTTAGAGKGGAGPSHAVVLLSRALDQAGDVLARVHPDQLHRSTPCRDWDVARLIAHLVAAPTRFLAAMRGEDPDWSAEPPPIGTEWAQVFRNEADDLIHAWHQQGDRADSRMVDWQTAEFAVHSWDLAQATGQSTRLDQEVAEQALAFMASGLTPDEQGRRVRPRGRGRGRQPRSTTGWRRTPAGSSTTPGRTAAPDPAPGSCA